MTDIVVPPEIDELPPAPLPTDPPEVFDPKAFALTAAEVDMVPQINEANLATRQNAIAAQERATSANQSMVTAGEHADAANAAKDLAAASAASAVNAPGTSATSTDYMQMSVPGGAALFIGTNKFFAAGQPIVIVRTSAPGAYAIYGRVTNYDKAAGVLYFVKDKIVGDGLFNDWTISLTGLPGKDSAQTGGGPGDAVIHRALRSGAYIDQTFINVEVAGPTQLGATTGSLAASATYSNTFAYAVPGAEVGDFVSVSSSTGLTGTTPDSSSVPTAITELQRARITGDVVVAGKVLVTFTFKVFPYTGPNYNYLADAHTLFIRVSKRIPE